MVRLLERLGTKVHYNPEQTCCGHLAWTKGQKELTRPVAEKWIRDFDSGKSIVCPAGACTSMVKNYYGEMFSNSSLHLKLKSVQSKTFELSQFLVHELKVTDTQSRFEGSAVFHDCCYALREAGIRDEPHLLLSQVKGLKLLQADNQSECCGFGNTFSVEFEKLSTVMAEKKIAEAQRLQVDYIISTDYICLMQLQTYINAHKLSIKCMHLADVLNFGH